MARSLMIMWALLILYSGCSDKVSRVEDGDVRFSVQGPIVSDTSVAEYIPPIYEQYLVQISPLKKSIYIPFLVDSNTYHVTSHVAFKEINKDTIYSSGGTRDAFFRDFRFLEKGREYELSFFLSKPEFIPDTVLIWFKYYPDSLTVTPKTLKLAHSSYGQF